MPAILSHKMVIRRKRRLLLRKVILRFKLVSKKFSRREFIWLTDFNVKKSSLFGVEKITHEHVKNNKDVRAVLAKSDIRPENLPAEEDIMKLERRVKSGDNKFLKGESSFSGVGDK